MPGDSYLLLSQTISKGVAWLDGQKRKKEKKKILHFTDKTWLTVHK